MRKKTKRRLSELKELSAGCNRTEWAKLTWLNLRERRDSPKWNKRGKKKKSLISGFQLGMNDLSQLVRGHRLSTSSQSEASVLTGANRMPPFPAAILNVVDARSTFLPPPGQPAGQAYLSYLYLPFPAGQYPGRADRPHARILPGRPARSSCNIFNACAREFVYASCSLLLF